ncbi:hypothetical protein WJX84_009414 [Apatococcus fuscideae]|uniref:Nuclease associated modular domain-containing protein n=1 Tax=Apatococcus fuscideae TaxID=2026836 RepID=A0AAW1SM81_9CHLO
MRLCGQHFTGGLWLQPGQSKAGQGPCLPRARSAPCTPTSTSLRDISAAGLNTAEPVLRSNPLSYQPDLLHRAEGAANAAEEGTSEGKARIAAEAKRKRERIRRSADVKQRISDGMLLNWHQEPHRRLAVSEKLKGREPWNKGKVMSPETRAKMSRSHKGLKHSPAVKRKMGKAHTGLLHSAETMALISEQQWGRPKSEEHRQKIAAAQARRHAAQRVLKAVEDVHRSASGAEGSAPASSGCPKFPGRASDTRMTRGSVVKNYKAQLREYRALQAELAPWTAAFQGQYGHRPHLHDVEVTGITWLITKYKQYLILRERVLSDTNVLRSKLDSAAPDFDGGQARSDATGGLGSMRSFERYNANGPAGGRQLTGGKAGIRLRV